MTRRFLDDIRTDINAQIVPNAAGLITADILRPLMLDTIDSTIDDEAVVGSAGPILNLAVNDTTWTVIPCDVEVGGDAQFLIVDLPNDQVVSAPSAGWTYDITGLAGFVGGNSKVFEMAILVNGSPEGYIGQVNTNGNSKPASVQAYDVELSTLASSTFQLAIRSIGDDADTLDVYGHALIVNIKPTNNP